MRSDTWVTAPTFAELMKRATLPIPPQLLTAWIRLFNPHLTDVDLISDRLRPKRSARAAHTPAITRPSPRAGRTRTDLVPM